MSTPGIPDRDALGFSFVETDAFFRSYAETDRQPLWDAGEYLPLGPVTLPPAAAFFSYGLGIFEGLKAQRSADGRALLFRHHDNARRFGRSAERLTLPPFPENRFVAAIEELVRRNLRFVPPHGCSDVLSAATSWRLSEEHPDDLAHLGALGTIAARSGDPDDARSIAKRLASLDEPDRAGEPTYLRACIAAQLGEKQEAVALLRESFGRGRKFSTNVHRDSDLEPLRGYPPFEELLRPEE